MSQAEASAWWADVEHLREAAERRQAANADPARRRAADQPSTEELRARARAAQRVQDAGQGKVDELSARRAVSVDERDQPRPRRPVPIWLADDAFGDPVATARARASAPRRTVEIRGQLVPTLQPRAPLGAPETHPARRTRERPGSSLGAMLVSRPDRVAFWAFALGIALAVVAAATPH